MGNFVQFELWKDCSNGCKFCFNKGQKDIDKITSIEFIMDKLNDPMIKEYDEIGFNGGELFDKQLDDSNVEKKFYNMFDICIKLINEGYINKIYIASALLFDMKKHLIPFLDYANKNGILENLLLCSSYDLKYRFYTDDRKKLWQDNMIQLHQKYPTLKLHTEIILTGFFIDAVLNDEFNIQQFCDTYHTRIDYIEPSSGLYYYDIKDASKDLINFFPTKEQFMKFLNKTIIQKKEIDVNTFLSPELRSDKIYSLYNGKRYVMENRRKNKMQIPSDILNVKYESGLIDTDMKMVDIVNELRQIMS